MNKQALSICNVYSFLIGISAFFRAENMAVDAVVQNLPPLIADDAEWGDYFFGDDSVDLERFFDQALHMLDNEVLQDIEVNPAQSSQQPQAAPLPLRHDGQPNLQPALHPPPQNVPDAAEGTSHAADQAENQQNNTVSSTFLEEQRREMCAFLRKLGLRQATTD